MRYILSFVVVALALLVAEPTRAANTGYPFSSGGLSPAALNAGFLAAYDCWAGPTAPAPNPNPSPAIALGCWWDTSVAGHATYRISADTSGSHWVSLYTLNLSTYAATIAGAAITDLSNVTNGSLANTGLAYSSVTVNGHSLSLGGALTLAFTDFAGSISAGQMLALPTGDIYVGNGSNQPSSLVLGSGVQPAMQNAANATSGFGTVGTSGAHVGLLNANKTDSGNNVYVGVQTFENTVVNCNPADRVDVTCPTFGTAVADNFTDSTAAINAANAAAFSVNFPATPSTGTVYCVPEGVQLGSFTQEWVTLQGPVELSACAVSMTASASGGVLTVSSVLFGSGHIAPNNEVYSASGADLGHIIAQLTGSTGSTGTYSFSSGATIGSETMQIGMNADTVTWGPAVGQLFEFRYNASMSVAGAPVTLGGSTSTARALHARNMVGAVIGGVLNISGGYSTLLHDGASADNHWYDIFAGNPYGPQNVVIKSGGFYADHPKLDQNCGFGGGAQFPSSPPAAWVHNTTYSAGAFVTDGNYLIQASAGGTSSNSAGAGTPPPTILPYGVGMPDGAGSLTWQLCYYYNINPGSSNFAADIQFDGPNAGVDRISNADTSGPWTASVLVSDYSNAGGPQSITIDHGSVFAPGLYDIYLQAGNNITIANSLFNAPAASGSANYVVAGAFKGDDVLEGNTIVGAGGQLIYKLGGMGGVYTGNQGFGGSDALQIANQSITASAAAGVLTVTAGSNVGLGMILSDGGVHVPSGTYITSFGTGTGGTGTYNLSQSFSASSETMTLSVDGWTANNNNFGFSPAWGANTRCLNVNAGAIAAASFSGNKCSGSITTGTGNTIYAPSGSNPTVLPFVLDRDLGMPGNNNHAVGTAWAA